MFLEAMGGTTPLAGRDRLPLPPKPPSPVRQEVLPPEVTLAVDADGSRYAARAPGVSHAQIAELRAGRLRASSTLDLHGERTDAATAKLRQFLFEVTRTNQRVVLVIHGKGTHSDHGAPLREAVLGELLGACSGFVHAFATASPADGGEGATFILLRGRK
jgi:DNA-nicking Smr family endonuclease